MLKHHLESAGERKTFSRRPHAAHTSWNSSKVILDNESFSLALYLSRRVKHRLEGVSFLTQYLLPLQARKKTHIKFYCCDLNP